jgi:hypothetical protein
MADQVLPYIARKPGDLITSQDWNGVQELVRTDIETQIARAVAAIKTVDQAHDTERLGGKSADELAQQVFEYVLRQLPKRTGYLNLFKKLEVGKESVIEHKLGTFPLVDLYQLDYFDIVASEDGHVFQALATFYLHHSSEAKIRFRPEETPAAPLHSVDIDPEGTHPFHIPFTQMLELYGVASPEDATLDDIEAEFWAAFNQAPNDSFDDDQYFHSPWFDRCCGERRTVKQLARDWNNIYFQMRPRKTANYTVPPGAAANRPLRAPTNVQVAQFDLASIGLTLLSKPDVPAPVEGGLQVADDHLKLLVLLKV